MNEPTTTYTVRALKSRDLYEFTYDLDGHLRQFTILEGALTRPQMKTFFRDGYFPAYEGMMKALWMKKLKMHFDIEVGTPDLSFEKFWQLYNHKVKKQASQKAWQRLGKKDKMEAIKAIKSYNGYLYRKGVAKAHASTYLNQRYFEDHFASIH